MSKPSVKSIVRAIGREKMESALNVGGHSIRNAAWAGKFPAKWYDVVSSLCKQGDIDCPRSLFSFTPRPKGLEEGSPSEAAQ